MAFDAQKVADKLIPDLLPSIKEAESVFIDLSEKLDRLSAKVWEQCKDAPREIDILDLFERLRVSMLEGLDQKARLRRANILNSLRRRVIAKWRAENVAPDSRDDTPASIKAQLLDAAKFPLSALVGSGHWELEERLLARYVAFTISKCARSGTQLQKAATEVVALLDDITRQGKDAPHDLKKTAWTRLVQMNNLLQKKK